MKFTIDRVATNRTGEYEYDLIGTDDVSPGVPKVEMFDADAARFFWLRDLWRDEQSKLAELYERAMSAEARGRVPRPRPPRRTTSHERPERD